MHAGTALLLIFLDQRKSWVDWAKLQLATGKLEQEFVDQLPFESEVQYGIVEARLHCVLPEVDQLSLRGFLGDLSGLGIQGGNNDNHVLPFREDLVPFLKLMRAREWGESIVTLNTNRDIGNWSEDVSEEKAAVRKKGTAAVMSMSPTPRVLAVSTMRA